MCDTLSMHPIVKPNPNFSHHPDFPERIFNPWVLVWVLWLRFYLFCHTADAKTYKHAGGVSHTNLSALFVKIQFSIWFPVLEIFHSWTLSTGLCVNMSLCSGWIHTIQFTLSQAKSKRQRSVIATVNLLRMKKQQKWIFRGRLITVETVIIGSRITIHIMLVRRNIYSKRVVMG